MTTSCGPPLDRGLEVLAVLREEPERRPGGRIAECADRVAGDAVRDRRHQIDVAFLAFAVTDAARDLLEPAGSLAARRALTARLVREELEDAPQRARDVGLVIHHDDAARAGHRAQRAAAAEGELLTGPHHHGLDALVGLQRVELARHVA